MKFKEDEGLEAVLGGAEMVDKEPLPVSAPEEKRPSLSLEELEAKQGNIIKNTIVKNMYPVLLKTLCLFTNSY